VLSDCFEADAGPDAEPFSVNRIATGRPRLTGRVFWTPGSAGSGGGRGPWTGHVLIFGKRPAEVAFHDLVRFWRG